MRSAILAACLLALLGTPVLADDAIPVERESLEKSTAQPAAKKGATFSFGSLLAPLFGEPKAAKVEPEATHHQTGTIQMARTANDPHRVNAFCLDADGNILAACGEGPGEIRKLDAEGTLLASWEIDVKPEAISAAPDGTILVGGHGKLFRFSAEGTMLATADSPHAEAVRENKGKLREQVIAQLKAQSNRLESQIEVYESIIAQLEQKKEEGKLQAQEEKILESLPKTLAILKRQMADREEQESEDEQISEKQIDEQLKYMLQSKMRVASISSDGKGVYVATYALEGYTFCVWRLDADFGNGEVVVKDLRGCCGQMDVQVCESGIFVAENSRHRVARFNADGSLNTTWGKQDRSGADGFTGCCNPMNVCFSRDGDVFTAESESGRIQRYGADGKFKDVIGSVKLVPGCKNVSIAVSPDTDRVYMLDITRNHIIVMQRKTAEPAQEEKPAKVTLK
jgi:hypothetical protein